MSYDLMPKQTVMSASYEAIGEYQRLVENAVNQIFFFCQIWSMNQLNIQLNYLENKKVENRPF